MAIPNRRLQVKAILAILFTLAFGEVNVGMKALLFLVILDFFTKLAVLSKAAGGVWNALTTDVISSYGMKKTITKACCYMALVIMTHQLEHFTVFGLVMGYTPVEITCAYLALIEAKSILENLRDTGIKGLEPFIGFLGEKQKKLTGKKD